MEGIGIGLVHRRSFVLFNAGKCHVNPEELGALEWLMAAVAAVCIGLSKTGFGGVGMIAIVLMATILPPKESTGTILTLLIVADVYAVTAFRRHVLWQYIARLLPAAIVGVVCGFFIMRHLPSEGFGPLIGWFVLGMLGLIGLLRAFPRLADGAAAHPAFALSAGWLGGVSTMLANAAGPVMTIYLLACRLPKMEFVGTAAWFFFIINLSKVPLSASMGLVNSGSLHLTLLLAPFILLGAAAGRSLLGLINQRVFEGLLVLFALGGALRLILA